MKQNWSEDELAVHWSLSDDEKDQIDSRTDHGRLGFAVLLKYLKAEGRFPQTHRDVPKVVVDFLAEELCITASTWNQFNFDGRTVKRIRAQIRNYLGFRPVAREDTQKIQKWLILNIIPYNPASRHLQGAVLDWCKEHKVESPTNERIERLIGAAIQEFEKSLFNKITESLPPATLINLDNLLKTSIQEDLKTEDEPEYRASVFSQLKPDAGRASLASVEKEVSKLKTINQLELPSNILSTMSSKVLKCYQLRTATESVWEVRRHNENTRYALLSIFCWQRRKEITDALVDLLLQIVHKISVRAEKKVYNELLGELEKVEGKNTLLFKLAEATLNQPEGMVKDVIFPVVNEDTLQALVKEYQSQGPGYQRKIHQFVRRSFSHHYRRMLPLILRSLIFQSNNTQHQPVITALKWLHDNRADRRKIIPLDELSIDGVVQPKFQDILFEKGPNEEDRINRIDYEICVFRTLRKQLRWIKQHLFCNLPTLPAFFVG